MSEVGAAGRRFRNLNDLGAALSPRQDVGVMLVGTDDDAHRFSGSNRAGHAEQFDQPVETSGGPGTGEYDGVRILGAATVRNERTRLAAQTGHEAPAIGRLGVTVGIVGQHVLKQKELDLAKRPAGGDIVGVDQILCSVGTFNPCVGTDQIIAEVGDQIGAL